MKWLLNLLNKIRPLSLKEQLLSFPCPRCGAQVWKEDESKRWCSSCGFIRRYVIMIN